MAANETGIFGRGRLVDFGSNYVMTLGRAGRAVVIMGQDPQGKGAKTTMAPGLARDLARLIGAAAAKAEKKL